MFCTFTALRSRKLLPNNHITCIQQSAKFHSSRAWKIVHRSTHYSTLGIPTTSTAKDIKAAYYESSKRWHPDRNKGSNEAHQKFLKISEAYSVLGNERKRRDYDRSLMRSGVGGGSSHSSAPHRYHNTAFSSSGEYSSAKRSSEWRQSSTSGATGSNNANTGGHRRPQGAYGRHSSTGQRAKSNFEEWERKHYWEMKEKAENIGRQASSYTYKRRYRGTQVFVYQLWEFVVAFTVVFGVGWAAKSVIFISDNRKTTGYGNPSVINQNKKLEE